MSQGNWHHAVIAFLSRLVPRERRAEWRREWEAELHHFELELSGRPMRTWRVLARSLGAVADACYLSEMRMTLAPGVGTAIGALAAVLATMLAIGLVPASGVLVLGQVKWSAMRVGWLVGAASAVLAVGLLLWLSWRAWRSDTAPHRLANVFAHAAPTSWLVSVATALALDTFAISSTGGFPDAEHFWEYFGVGVIALPLPFAVVVTAVFFPVTALFAARFRATSSRLALIGLAAAPLGGLLLLVLGHALWGGLPFVDNLARFLAWPFAARLLAFCAALMVGGAVFGVLFARRMRHNRTPEPQNPRTQNQLRTFLTRV